MYFQLLKERCTCIGKHFNSAKRKNRTAIQNKQQALWVFISKFFPYHGMCFTISNSTSLNLNFQRPECAGGSTGGLMRKCAWNNLHFLKSSALYIQEYCYL